MLTIKEVLDAQKRDFMIYLIPTYDCNLRCTYCFVPKYGGYKINSETLEDLSICLEKYVQTSKITIGILGGEPFFYKDLLIDTISFLSKRLKFSNMEFYIGTNGLLIDEKVLKSLKEIDVRIEIAFSIDGEPETLLQDRIKKGTTSFAQKIIDNFQLAKKILGRENVSVTMTVSTKSIQMFQQNIKYIFKLNPYFLRFRLAAGDTWDIALMDIYLEQFYKICIYYIDTIYIEKKENFIPVIEQFEQIINIKMKNLGPCSKGINLTLTPDGYFVPCYNYLTKEKQEAHKFPFSVSQLATSGQHDIDFQQWRAKAQSNNNGRKDSNNINIEARYNYAKCITGDYKGEALESILDAWDHREVEERKIGTRIFFYYYDTYGINLSKERVYKR